MPVWRRVAGGALVVAAAASFVPLTWWVARDGWASLPTLTLTAVLAAAALLLLRLPGQRRDAWWMIGAVAGMGAANLALPELEPGYWHQLAYVSAYAATACLVPPFLRYPAQSPPARTVAGLTGAAWAVLVGLPLASAALWQPAMDDYAGPAQWLTLYPWEDAARALPLVVPVALCGVVIWFTVVQWQRQRFVGGPARPVVRLLAALTTVMAWGMLARTALDVTEHQQLSDAVAVVHVTFTAAAVVTILVVALGITLRRAAYVEDLVAAAGRPSAIEQVLRRYTADPSLRLMFLTEEGWTDAEGRVAVDGGRPGRAVHTVVAEGGSPVVTVEVASNVDLDDRTTHAIIDGAGFVLQSARLAVQQAAQAVELRESRRRIVESSVAQRRRMERDLHDGAQQHLLAAQAALSRAELVREPEQVDDAIREARERLATTMDELRSLARGVHPALLSQAGLGAALHSLTSLSDRVRVDVDPVLDGRRFPAVTEATAWFVASEAVVNALRHQDEPVQVEAALDGDDARLVCTVADRGAGGATVTPGGGLAGLRDRVRASGGELEVTSEPGLGTTVRAWLPIAEGERP